MTMKEQLDAIRAPRNTTFAKAALATCGMLVLGICLGVFSKWLDDLAFDGTMWWHAPIETLDLGNFFSDFAIWLLLALLIAVFSASALRAAVNVFAFFAGMCTAYHWYTLQVSGFDPISYMMIWYALTLASPFLAMVCWYARGKGPVAIILEIVIIAVFSLCCFSIGMLYFDGRGILYTLVFIAAVAALCQSPKQFLVSVPAGILLAFLASPMWLFQ